MIIKAREVYSLILIPPSFTGEKTIPHVLTGKIKVIILYRNVEKQERELQNENTGCLHISFLPRQEQKKT